LKAIQKIGFILVTTRKTGMNYDPDMHALLKAVKASSRSPADSINILRERQRPSKAAPPAEAARQREAVSPEDSHGE
jgi:hypothetical protein